MAFISCPECEKKVPDTSASCPYCGAANPYVKSSRAKLRLVIEEELKNKPRKSSKLKKAVKAAVCVIIIALVALAGLGYFDLQSKNNYVKGLNSALGLMLSGAQKSNNIHTLTMKVWSNAKLKEKDPSTDKYTTRDSGSGVAFNDVKTSIENLNNDEKIKKAAAEIKANKKDVDKAMETISKPPAEFKICYSRMNALYSSYTAFITLAPQPAGELGAYVNKVKRLGDDFTADFTAAEKSVPEVSTRFLFFTFK